MSSTINELGSKKSYKLTWFRFGIYFDSMEMEQEEEEKEEKEKEEEVVERTSNQI